MDSEKLENNFGLMSLNHFKVNHPETSNNIVQMRSAGFQPPFYFGGSQIPYSLGKENPQIPEQQTYKIYLGAMRQIMSQKK